MSLRLQLRRYTLPFRQPVRTAHGLWTEREGLLLRLENSDGGVGFGEVAPLPAFGTPTVEELERQLRSLGDLEPGQTAARADLDGAVQFALASAEAACGGTPGPAPVREYWPVAALLPAGRAVLTAVSPLVDAGFRTFKWKVGVGDLADELALLDDVLARLPEGARLRLDANGAWERRQAVRWFERVADRPIEFIEQPVAATARGADDVLQGLAADYPTPVALDESLVTAGDLERWIGRGWRGVWVVKLPLLGAPAEVLARLQTAQADVVFSSALETGLGAAAALKAAFRWPGPGVVRALGFGVWPLFADATFDGPHRAPFIRWADVGCQAAALWSALEGA